MLCPFCFGLGRTVCCRIVGCWNVVTQDPTPEHKELQMEVLVNLMQTEALIDAVEKKKED